MFTNKVFSISFLISILCLLDVKSDTPYYHSTSAFWDGRPKESADQQILLISQLKQKSDELDAVVKPLIDSNKRFMTQLLLNKFNKDNRELEETVNSIRQMEIREREAQALPTPQQNTAYRTRLIQDYKNVILLQQGMKDALEGAVRLRSDWENEKRLMSAFKERAIAVRKNELNIVVSELRNKINVANRDQLIMEASLSDFHYLNFENQMIRLERLLAADYMSFDHTTYFNEKQKLKELHNLLDEHRAKVEKRKAAERIALLQQQIQMQGPPNQDSRKRTSPELYQGGPPKTARGTGGQG